MFNRGIITAIFCIVLLQNLPAQKFPELNFSYLNVNNGLPTNLITSVFRDNRGLIWFGSENNGLLRYDGKKIKTFYSSEPGKGIAVNYVGSICQDKQGWLWMQTLEGLYRMNPVTEEIELYQHDPANKKSVNTNEKPLPFVDSKGNIWISGYEGFQQFDLDKKEFINYFIPAIANPAWQKNARCTGNVFEDSKGRLWVTCSYGIYLVDSKSRALKPYFNGKYASATSITENADHDLLVSFWGLGIMKVDTESGRYTPYLHENAIVNSIGYWQDVNGKKWLYYILANDEHRFSLCDTITRKYKQYIINDATTGNISLVYNEQGNRLWLITANGLCIADKNQQQFSKFFLFSYFGKNKEIYGEPRSLLVSKNEFVLATWATGKLYHYNKNWQLKLAVNGIPPKPARIWPYSIHTIQEDEYGAIWYGTDSGLIKHTHAGYKRYLPTDSFYSVEYKNSARDMLKRKDGLYWVRFTGRGIYVFDPFKGKFTKRYPLEGKRLANCISYDKKGKLWLGTSEGLYAYEKELDSFVRFPLIGYNSKLSQQYENVYQVYFDRNNIGWIGTYYGLIKINADNSVVEYIIDPAKKMNYNVLRLLSDSIGNLWFISNTSLNSYNTQTSLFRYYTPENGLPQNFIGFPGVLQWLDDSTIAAGSMGTITTFNPYRLMKDDFSVKIIFTDVVINNKRIGFEDVVDNTLPIPPGAKLIYIHFALLHYTAPQQNKLYYRITSKKDSAWILSNDGDINLYNLPPGKYHLQVKGEFNGNAARYKLAELKFIIKPYWYQSDLFKTSSILLLCCAVYFFIRWRLKTVRQSAYLKQRIAQTEMAALKAQMNPHFMFNCINSIDAFIQTNDKYNATLYLNKFAKLIRNVLDSSKENVVSFSRDIDTLKLYIELEELRSENKFISKLEIDGELLLGDYKVPPLIIQPFIENAIIHGLRNREQDGGLLELIIFKDEQNIIYKIRDNGIGRIASGLLNKGREKSYGMQMSADRIRLFNKEGKASLMINDLYNNLTPAGTEVVVKLKII